VFVVHGGEIATFQKSGTTYSISIADVRYYVDIGKFPERTRQAPADKGHTDPFRIRRFGD